MKAHTYYVYMHACTNVYTYTYIHTHTHVYIYTYIYIHICIRSWPLTASCRRVPELEGPQLIANGLRPSNSYKQPSCIHTGGMYVHGCMHKMFTCNGKIFVHEAHVRNIHTYIHTYATYIHTRTCIRTQSDKETNFSP
jgi:hypothetical protein